MTIKELQEQLKTIKKGVFTRAKWQSVKGEYTKVSTGKVRLVKYANIKGVQVKGKANANDNAIIDNVLYYNANTNNYLVQLAKTNTKAKVIYYHNGKEITKAEYDANVKQSAYKNDSPIFRVKLENLLALGK